MSIERRAIALFQDALDQPEATRRDWLKSACGEDAQLFSRVTRLLEADADGGDLHTGAALRHALSAEPPEQLGPYRIVEAIGEGGMGIVYRGERADGAYERTVAIKLLGAGAELSDEARRRFTNERQILAQMSHPNVAQLLDGGSEGQHPYIVMEYVDGAPLIHDPNRTTDETLRLFIKVCEAVAYAHDRFVLHRDIKPGNVLLTRDGEPKLLDFEIAKINQSIADAQTLALTGAEPAPMTLTYSAPERLLGEEATVTADVYSLGVCLFELLTGETAVNVAGKTLGEAYKIVSETDLGARSAHLPADLGVIIGTAAHTDPQRRYSSAASMAQDVARFLESRPIQARGDDWRYLVGRFLARYRFAVGASVAGVVVLIGALAVAVNAYLESERQTAIAERERATADDTVEYLSSLIVSTNPWESGADELTVSEILAQAETQLSEGTIEDPIAQMRIQIALSRVHDGRGEYERALAYAEEAFTRGEAQPLSREADLLRHVTYGQALHNNGRNEEAVDVLADARALATATPPLLRGEFDTLIWLGPVYEDLVQESEAERAYLRAIEIAESVDLKAPEAVAQAYNNLGRLRHKQGEWADAERLYRRSVELLDGRDVQRAIGLANLAGVYNDAERYDEAEAVYLESLALFERSVGIDHPQAIVARTTLSNLYVRMNRVTEARTLIERTLDDALSGLGEAHFLTAYVQNVGGVAFCEAPYDEQGLDLAERSLATRRALLPPDHWTIGSGMRVLGKCQLAAGDPAGALMTLEAGRAILLETRDADDAQVQRIDEVIQNARAQMEG